MNNTNNYKTLHLYTDGGSRGNPGPAAIGMVIKTPEGKTLEEKGECIGKGTNNEAEYKALIEGLAMVEDYKPENLVCFLDSSLVVNQLNGKFKVKQAHLRQLVFEVRRKMANLPGTSISFQHVPRDENAHADALLNQAFATQNNSEL